MLRYTHSFFFFFNDTATIEIYTLSLHDALPIYFLEGAGKFAAGGLTAAAIFESLKPNYAWAQQVPKDDRRIKTEYATDRKSTRLNSSHGYISYAVFCLKKKKKHR